MKHWSAERLKQVKAPTLVIMGTKDPDFSDPAAEGKYIAEQTGGHLELIEGAGHYPQTEMSDKTAPIVVDFLDRSAQDELLEPRVDRLSLKNTPEFNTA